MNICFSLIIDHFVFSNYVENNQFDPNVPPGTNGLEDTDDFGSLGGSNPMGLPPPMMGPGGPISNQNGPPPPQAQWCPSNGPQNNGNNTPQPQMGSLSGMAPPSGPNGPNSHEDVKKQSPGM